MSEASFSIAYRGPAVDDGTMDIKLVAPSLVALADLLSAANQSLNGDRVTLRLKLSAGVRHGSFETLLETVTTVLDMVSTIRHMTAAEVMASIFGVGGALAALRWLRGEAPASKRKLPGGGLRFTNGDGDELDVSAEVARLLGADGLIELIGRVADPLSTDGVDSVDVMGAPEYANRMSESDLPYLRDRIITHLVERKASRQRLELASPKFDEPGRKWEFLYAGNRISARIDDQAFNADVQEGARSFARGDILVVELVTESRQVEDALPTFSYSIEAVHEVEHAGTQLPLPGDEPTTRPAE